MAAVVVGQIIGVRGILQEIGAFLETDPDDERVRFRGQVHRQAGHETAGYLQDWGPVVPDTGLDARQ